MAEFIKKLEQKCSNWNISKTDTGLEISQYTDAGEDFSFEVDGETPKKLADAIDDYYENFDPEEHVIMWLEAKKNGVKGVPNVFVLVEDAKKIDEDLEDLSIKAYEISEKINEEVNLNKQDTEPDIEMEME